MVFKKFRLKTFPYEKFFLCLLYIPTYSIYKRINLILKKNGYGKKHLFKYQIADISKRRYQDYFALFIV